MRKRIQIIAAGALVLALSGNSLAAEPDLPFGLGGEGAQIAEPSLPSGLGNPGTSQQDTRPEETSLADALEIGGFLETRYGARTSDFGTYDQTTIGEARMQIEAEWAADLVTINLTTDLVVDSLSHDSAVDLEGGEGWIDLREASALFRPFDALDLKIGRQVLTWGTGDLVFINDLFPKDWNSFFVGRDDEYLKAPSDAIKASFYWNDLTLDAVYTPRFDTDRFIDGRRLTYFDDISGTSNSDPSAIAVVKLDQYGDDWEGALRLSGRARSFEWAAYLYRGYWKSPAGFDPALGKATFPELNVYGASLRGPVAGGIVNAETGFYDARDDGAAADPLLPNSEWRFLAGFEREVVPDLTASVQFYVEHMSDHDDYITTLPAGLSAKDENRQLVTLRLTQMAMNQNLILSVFNFWSPTEEDGHLRLKAGYKLSDSWKLEGGANVFYGKDVRSFFGQFEDNSNIFISARMSF